MEKLKNLQVFQKNMVWTSNSCEKHVYFHNGEERVKTIGKMLIDGKEVCPRCEAEAANSKLTVEIQEWYKTENDKVNLNVFTTKSILADKTLLLAQFQNYMPTIEEEKANKLLCQEIVERLNRGEGIQRFDSRKARGWQKSSCIFNSPRVE